MTNEFYDTIIIGSGPAGEKLAQLLAKNGKTVALIERDKFGGVCPNRGCFPKKMMVTRAATALATRGSNEQFFSGACKSTTLDFQELSSFVRAKLEPIDPKKQQSYQKLGITCIRGDAHCSAPGKVSVNELVLSSKNIVVATGGHPRPLRCEGAELVTDSAGFFKLEDLPERILFIGGGYISLEFATVALAAGRDITILTRGDNLLSQYDSRLTNLLRKQYETYGIKFITNETVKSIAPCPESENSYKVTCNSGALLSADLIINATGRVPNLGNLNLVSLGKPFQEENFRPSRLHYNTPNDTHTFFIGDITVDPELPFVTQAHKEAEVVADFILNGTPVDKNAISIGAQSVFTYPELAIVSDSESLEQSDNVSEIFIESLGLHNYYSLEHTGALVQYNKESGEIYSVCIVAPAASEIINAYATHIELKLSIHSLDKEIAAFPTIARTIAGAIMKELRT